MSRELTPDQKEQAKPRRSPDREPTEERSAAPGPLGAALLRLQRLAGNRAVQRLLAQRQGGSEGASASPGPGSAGFELDDETAGRITRARGGGQPLQSDLQAQMGEALGYDFGGVRVHTGTESDELNQQLSARAFTTGQDIFVRSGDYNPASSGGRELIAHELSHVVQQGTGQVPSGGSGMTVRPAGDAFEQEADALAQQAANAGPAVAPAPGGEGVQRQEDEEELQMSPAAQQPAVAPQQDVQRQEDEEELQMMPAASTQQDVQRQDDEEELQMSPAAQQPAVATQQDVQRQEDEEEELQMSPAAQQPAAATQGDVQRQEDEEELQMMPAVAQQPAAATQGDVQRQDDEEELQMMPAVAATQQAVATQQDVQRHEDRKIGE